MLNTREILKLAKEKNISQKQLADAIGCAQSTLNLKIHNKRRMDLEEAEKLQITLEIPDSCFGFYFFANVVA